MKIQTGYLYHIKDEFFDKINEDNLMINHKNNHSRPSYLAIKDKSILWFIPLSSKIDKYKNIVDKKIQKYGECKTILIREISGRKQVILIQNAFPTLEKYVKSIHEINGKPVKVSKALEKDITSNLKHMLSLKEKGLNLFFVDIDKINDKMLKEIKEQVYS